MQRIDAWMTRDPICVGSGTPISECAQLMHNKHIRHLPVTDRDGRLISLLADFEIFQRGWMAGQIWVPHDDADQWLRAQDLARAADVVCSPEDSLSGALQDLRRSFHDAVVVVADGVPVGILTEHDVVVYAAQRLVNGVGTVIKDTELLSVQRGELAVVARGGMAANRVRHLVVLDGERLHGVLSFRDVAVESQLDGVRCEDVVSFGPVHHAVGGISRLDAARIMAKEKIGCLPVVDEEGRPIQMITRSDLVGAVLQQLVAA